jgi:tetratricopeptide (TPR) repeat protein
MVTLRTYSNQMEAAMAKSLLDDQKIVCRLADENSNLYGGGPLAMPIRLLVAEEQVERARHILDDARQPLPDDFDPGDNAADKTRQSSPDILVELARVRRANRWIAGMTAVLLGLTIYLISELPSRTTDPWSNVSRAIRKYDYKTALDLAKHVAAEHPSDFYAHEYLGSIYLEMGDLPHAESEYTRAYELSPPQGLQEKVRAIRERRQREESTQRSPAPIPYQRR